MSLTESEIESLYGLTKAEISSLAEAALQDVIASIEAGASPRAAVESALKEFGVEFEGVLQGALAGVMGTTELVAYTVAGVSLSAAIYANVNTVSAAVRQVVNDHLQFQHDARALALELFEGYDARPREILPVVQLPKYLRDAAYQDPVNALMARINATTIKTPALRAAYLEALDAIIEGKGKVAIERALRTAFYERTRFHAARIAQTELARAQQARIAADYLDSESMEYLQIRLSKSHPAPDLCDLIAGQDRYGLGPGVYPKKLAPVPPFHPFCRCLIRPRIDLVDVTPKYNPKAGADYLRGLDKDVARRVAGSKAKRAQILRGAKPENVWNKKTPDDYKIRPAKDKAKDKV